MPATIMPTLVLRASKIHNGDYSQWSIYSEPRGVPYSYTIRHGKSSSVQGSADTLQQARDRVNAWYAHTAIQS